MTVFSIDFLRQPWISLRCRFHSSAVTQFQTWFLVLQWLSFHWLFLDQHWHSVFDNSMRKHESIFAIGFSRRSWILWRCRLHTSAATHFTVAISGSKVTLFSWQFLDQHWHSVFDDSLRQTRIYFCYWFHASVVNSLTVSTPYVSCHSYFSVDFWVYSDFVLGDDFWSVVTQFSLAIPCLNGDSLFSFDFVRQPWIRMRCRFHSSAWLSFKDDFSLYSD
jgi:hypothetical protein